MSESLYPHADPKWREQCRALTGDTQSAWQAFSRQVLAEGPLPAQTKPLIAVAVAHVTPCPYCIGGHTRAALRQGASREENMEAIEVAAEMRAGGAYAHSIVALAAIEAAQSPHDPR